MKSGGSDLEDETMQRKTSSSHCVSVYFYERKSPMKCNKGIDCFSLAILYLAERGISKREKKNTKESL